MAADHVVSEGPRTAGPVGKPRLYLLALLVLILGAGLGAAATTACGSGWEVVPAGALNVRHFGARGDGRASDSRAIQGVLDDVAQPGDTIYFPAGVYLLDTTLNVSKNN